MKVFRNKLTGRIGETQFGEDAEVLIRNARAAGFTDDKIEVIDMTPEEYNRLIIVQNENDLSPEAKRERKISKEKDKILRELAIANLEARGEI